MTSLPAVPWPDAAGRAAAAGSALAVRAAAQGGARIAVRSRTDFLLGVFVVLVFSGAWVVFLTGPEGEARNGGAIVALFTPGYAAALALLARAGRRSVQALASIPLIWGLMALVAASVLWSVDPATTARRAPALFFTILAGVALAASFDWAELSEVIATGYAVIIVGCFVMGLLAPNWGRMTTLFPGAWRGLWNEKNALGGAMAKAFGLLAGAAALNPRRRWLWAGFALLALALIALSQSKTALLTALLGGGMIGFVAVVRRGGAPAVLASFAAAAALGVLGVLAVSDREALFRLLGKDATLTGRTQIWAAALQEIAKSPLHGYGYMAVWQDADRWAPLAWIVKHAKFRAFHAHNAWIETWLGLGYVGLAAFGAVMLEMWVRTAAAVYTSRGAWLALPFLAVYTLLTLTESVGYIYNDLTWVVFTALLARLATPERSAPRASGAAGP